MLERLHALSLTATTPSNTRNAQGPIVDPDALARVAWRRLRRLELARLRITVDGLRDLLASPHLGRVERLALRLRLDRTDLARVVGELALPALRSLDLTRNQVDAEVLDGSRPRQPARGSSGSRSTVALSLARAPTP